MDHGVNFNDMYCSSLLNNVFSQHGLTDLSGEACALTHESQLTGVEHLESFLDNEIEAAVGKTGESTSALPSKGEKKKLVTDDGRISFREIKFDTKSNVGAVLMEYDGLGVTSCSNFSTIRANACVFRGKWLFELLLGSKGVMQLGWCTLKCKFSSEEGVGDTHNSYAYDGNRLRKWNVQTSKYGEQWLTGDVITCCIDCDEGTITFYRNGKNMGLAFPDINLGFGMAYFPCVSLSQGENLHANFGATPLRYPVPGYKPLQDPPVSQLIKAELLLVYLTNFYYQTIDKPGVIGATYQGILYNTAASEESEEKPPPLSKYRSQKATNMLVTAHIFDKLAPLLKSPFIVEACLLPFLMKMCESDNYSEEEASINVIMEHLWTFLQEFEIKPCLEHLLLSLLQSYRFSSITEEFDKVKKYLILTVAILRHDMTRKHYLRNVLFEKMNFALFMHIKFPDEEGLENLIPTVWWETYSKTEELPLEPETNREKRRYVKFFEASEQLQEKLEVIERIQVEMLKILLKPFDTAGGETSRQIFLKKFSIFLRNNSGLGHVQQIAHCPPPVTLCFFHRLIDVLRYYWDEFQKEDPSRFVSSLDAFVPIQSFWSETRVCPELQRCGGLVSHLNRMWSDEIAKAQEKDGKTVKGYPELEMPSGNSLMDILDGIILLYHVAVHKQLYKLSSLHDNMKEYSIALSDTERKLQQCPSQLNEVKLELERSKGVFLEKLNELGRQMGWCIAMIYSKKKQENLGWLFGVVLRTLEKASDYKVLFQYVPEFYMETVSNLYNCLRNYFPSCRGYKFLPESTELTRKYAVFLVRHFADNRIVSSDTKDMIVQSLACFVCFPQCVKILEQLSDDMKQSLIRALVQPYENRTWVQPNWILVRIWKGSGYGFRYTHLPHLVPAKLQPSELGAASLQKPCPSCVLQQCLRAELLQDTELALQFLDSLLNQINWSFSEFIGMMQEIQQKIVTGRVVYLESRQLKICATCFEIAVNLLRVLEMLVALVPEMFLDVSTSSADLQLVRVLQVLCQILNRVTLKEGMFDTIVSKNISGLESVTHYPVLTVTAGILTQLICKPKPESQKRVIQRLINEPSFQLSALEFYLPPDDESADKGATILSPSIEFSLKKFEDHVSQKEIQDFKTLLEKITALKLSATDLGEAVSEEDLCTICYANCQSAVFVPCGHTSCIHCISQQMMRKKECFFCKAVITQVKDQAGKTLKL